MENGRFQLIENRSSPKDNVISNLYSDKDFLVLIINLRSCASCATPSSSPDRGIRPGKTSAAMASGHRMFSIGPFTTIPLPQFPLTRGQLNSLNFFDFHRLFLTPESGGRLALVSIIAKRGRPSANPTDYPIVVLFRPGFSIIARHLTGTDPGHFPRYDNKPRTLITCLTLRRYLLPTAIKFHIFVPPGNERNSYLAPFGAQKRSKTFVCHFQQYFRHFERQRDILCLKTRDFSRWSK